MSPSVAAASMQAQEQVSCGGAGEVVD